MKTKLLFVSQDQGSGNALCPVIRELLHDKYLRVRVFAARFSKDVFQEQGIDFSDLDNRGFKDVLNFKPDLIVTGASMRKCIEKDALLFARKNRIKALTVLDFWGNYWERFTVNGEQSPDSLPDHICIMDDIAREQMISAGFPEAKLVVTGNPYFDTFGIPETREDNLNYRSILYISQPVFQNGSYRSDLRPFEDLLDIVSGVDQKIRIIIRPHPKDEPGIFDRYKRDNLKVESRQRIGDLIMNSDIVIGKSSSVLFEAVFRGKLVISYQPVENKQEWLVTNQLGLSYLARTKPDLRKIIDNALNNQLRIKKLGVYKFYNDGKCSDRVIKKLKHIFT